MRMIEEFREAKTGRLHDCEDQYVLTEHYACVIDGATDVSGIKYHGLTSGQFISRTIANAIPGLHPEADLDQAVRHINEAVLASYEKEGFSQWMKENPSPPTAAMALYSRHKNVVWLIGDCQCMADGNWSTNPKLVDETIASIRSMYLEAELQRGKTVDELLENDAGFEAVRPFIQMQYYLQNVRTKTQYSYVAITGHEFDLTEVKTVNIPAGTKELILASDGYPALKPTLKETEAYLHYVLANDPLCFQKYKSVKGIVKGNVSFDDRTYIKINLNPG